MSDENYYEQLGVEPGASRDEIRDAHRARVADLEAAREKKGISDSQVQQNRDEVAQVRAAWNVLSDPFQRKRYDARLGAPDGDEIDLVDAEADDARSEPGTEVALTGWRKFMAPPPPKPTPTKNGANGSSKAKPTNKRQRPEPTIVIPGMQLAEPRQRGMAMLFDIAILMVIYTAVSFLLPSLVQSDYPDVVKQIDKIGVVTSAQGDLTDANKADATKSTAATQKDVVSKQKAFDKAVTDAKKTGVKPDVRQTDTSAATKTALDKQEQDLRDSIVGTQYLISITILVLGLLYLVPITVRTGHTLGMRNRRVKVVRVDGSPVTWWAAFARFFVPLAIAFVLLIQLSTLAPMIGLAIVGWSFFDKNRQGIHDKLARTVVVAA